MRWTYILKMINRQPSSLFDLTNLKKYISKWLHSFVFCDRNQHEIQVGARWEFPNSLSKSYITTLFNI